MEEKIPCQGILTVHKHSNLPFTGTVVVSATVKLGSPKECNVLISIYFAYCVRHTRVPLLTFHQTHSVFPKHMLMRKDREKSIAKKQSLFLCKHNSFINSYLLFCIASNSDDKIFCYCLSSCLLSAVSPELPGITLKRLVWLISRSFRSASSVS